LGRLNRLRHFAYFAIAFLLLTTASAATVSAKQTTATRVVPASVHSRRASTRSKSRRKRGQQVIDPVRVREIQAALIREKYLQGQPNGVWDARTKAAMVRYQSENGWQTKKLPDSRAIIKLGLGPDHADLINPDTAFIQPLPGKGGSQGNQ
jgi:peptidoglycan hydrolase-like protein with peptidoglycan-binding domain